MLWRRLFFLAISACALPAAAQDAPSLVFGAGAAGIWHHNSHVRDTVAVASMEYRSNQNLFWRLKPLAGALVTSDRSAYVHGGIYGDWAFASRWNAALHFSAGAYGHGEENNLCNRFEFQEGVDVMYRMNKGWRIGGSLRHLSNGGSGSCNPGIETLTLLVAVPIK